MNGEDHNYNGECVVCTTYLKLAVYNEDEPPQYCPLCGSTMDFEVADSDYT